MTTGARSDQEWRRVAAQLRANRLAQQEAWGDIGNTTLGRYLAGEVTAEDLARVETALQQHPELGKLLHQVAAVRGDLIPAETLPPASAASEAVTLPLSAARPLLAETTIFSSGAEPGGANEIPEEFQTCSMGTITDVARSTGFDVCQPERIGPYEVERELGRGSMGVVYLARQPELHRQVAVKVIRVECTTAEARARFRAEVIALAELKHANIVQIYDIGFQGHVPYFAFEYMDGGSLADHLGGNPQMPHIAAKVVESLARAMRDVHERGLVHRNLQPHSILVHYAEGHEQTPSGFGDASRALTTATLKLADFGLAKRIDVGASQTQCSVGTDTLNYRAPENVHIAQAARVGPAADVYSLGAILYEMLTGRPPFASSNTSELLDQVLKLDVTRPRRIVKNVPHELEAICLKCLQKDPTQRYPTAGELSDDLRRFLDNKPVSARPLSPAGQLWRLCRRRPGVALAAALLIALGTILHPVRHKLSGNGDTAIMAELAAGKAVQLIGETGSPAWYRLAGRGSQANVSVVDGHFNISAPTINLLELLPRVPQRFRFQAEVEQDVGFDGAVGIYFAYNRENRTADCFCSLTINQDKSDNQVAVEFVRYGGPNDLSTVQVLGKKLVSPLRPSHWRHLAVSVNPGGVEAFCDGQSIGNLPRADLMKHLAQLSIDSPSFQPFFVTSDALGLYVQSGVASFRNVWVEPLP